MSTKFRTIHNKGQIYRLADNRQLAVTLKLTNQIINAIICQ